MIDRWPLFDDRRFPDLVEQARAELRRRLADSGTDRPISTEEDAVLASAALLVDHLHDRLGSLADGLRGPLLDLIGLRPRGPHAARASVRFTFGTPLTGTLEIPAGTGIGPPSFTLAQTLRVVPNRVLRTFEDRGDVYTGLAGTIDRTAVELTGVVGARAAEAWDGRDWLPCRLRPAPGETLCLEPAPGHVRHDLDGLEAAWLRFPGASAPGDVDVRTVAAEALAVHAHRIAEEPLGISDGTAGQGFRLRERPAVVPGHDPVVETSTADGWQTWRTVESFGGTRPGDHHVRFDVTGGEVVFPPSVPAADGSRSPIGAVPPAGSLVRVRGYWTGGGAAGNVPAGSLRELGADLPGVRVDNPAPARGGSDAESETELWRRAPGLLRAGDRAVTAADHEELARRADPSLGRVRCVADQDSGTVQVLLVATPPSGRELRPSADDLRPSTTTFEAVRDHLDERRLLTTRLHVMPPHYQGVTVDAEIRPVAGADPAEVRDRAERALYAFLHPLTGGEHGTGWPFGEAVHESTVKKLLFTLPGVQDCVHIGLSPVDPSGNTPGVARTIIPLLRTALPLSVGHRIKVTLG
ncbi:putative baseplate assembly protein [Actinoplanes subglobosus]|uniref:Baseplate assembly protein n=1 Tax=Actinoplanes subglobosus TaxID=1547892 RepID=A0ABV8ILJ9_9ACTN